jgi:hypothetical protein
MTRYYSGCNRCGTHEGHFEDCLPNGICIDSSLGGFYFCERCETLLKEDKGKCEEIINKFKRIPRAALKLQYAAAHFNREEMESLRGNNGKVAEII